MALLGVYDLIGSYEFSLNTNIIILSKKPIVQFNLSLIQSSLYMFIVEDGTGLTNSTSYCSVADADLFADFWDYPDWALLPNPTKEKLLIRATKFLDENFKWKSSILSVEQALLLPRKPYNDYEGRSVEGIPTEVIEATAEIAILLEDYSQEDVAQVKTIISQEFGDSSEEYAVPYTVGSNPLLNAFNRIRNRLSKYGVGGVSFKQVRISRG